MTEFCARPVICRLRGGIQHYAWGTTDYIPALLDQPNPGDRPFAELWMGAHPDLPSTALTPGGDVGLDVLVAECPEILLGARDAERFDRELPYLFKVLSAAKPLSIQAHPTRSQAESGFARENALGIAPDAPERNYRDRNHKPELLVALTDFYALRGFRPPSEIASLAQEVAELESLLAQFEPSPEGLRQLYRDLMSMSQDEVDGILSPLIGRLRAEDATRPFSPFDRQYWVLEADRQFGGQGRHDRGLFSFWLLNLMHLSPGDGIYLPAGNLHSYLRGTGMELMANSNNVLRGGLTSKHVDIEELLEIVSFEGAPPRVIEPVASDAAGEDRYPTDASEFELRRIELSAGQPFTAEPAHGADIVIVTEAEAQNSLVLRSKDQEMELRRGDIFLVPADLPFSLAALAPATLFRATVPRGG